jgi:hypothetical protein
MILTAEAVLGIALFAPTISEIKRMSSQTPPDFRHYLSAKPVAVIKAVPPPVIQMPPKEIFAVVEEYRLAEPGALDKWQEKVFRDKTVYKTAIEGEKTFLRATSEKASSGLYLKNLDHKPAKDLYVEWEWRAVSFPLKSDKKRLSNREEDDFAARIYMVFPGTNLFNSNVLEYIWDESLPEGSVESSPFSGRVKLLVVRTGPSDPATGGGWRTERRNVYEDYRKYFGEDQKRSLGAIGFMSDSDNTKTSSEAHFNYLALKRKLTESKKGGSK